MLKGRPPDPHVHTFYTEQKGTIMAKNPILNRLCKKSLWCNVLSRTSGPTDTDCVDQSHFCHSKTLWLLANKKGCIIYYWAYLCLYVRIRSIITPSQLVVSLGLATGLCKRIIIPTDSKTDNRVTLKFQFTLRNSKFCIPPSPKNICKVWSDRWWRFVCNCFLISK